MIDKKPGKKKNEGIFKLASQVQTSDTKSYAIYSVGVEVCDSVDALPKKK